MPDPDPIPLCCPRCNAPLFAFERNEELTCHECDARLVSRCVTGGEMFAAISHCDWRHITPDHLDDIELDARDTLANPALMEAAIAARTDRSPTTMLRVVAAFILIASSYPASRCARRGLPEHLRGWF